MTDEEEMTLLEALSQPTYPEGQFANGWYFCSDGRVYCVFYASKEELLSDNEKDGYYLCSYPAGYQSSKFLELRHQLGNTHFQTFEELENAVLLEHALRVDGGWYPDRNPFGE